MTKLSRSGKKMPRTFHQVKHNCHDLITQLKNKRHETVTKLFKNITNLSKHYNRSRRIWCAINPISNEIITTSVHDSLVAFVLFLLIVLWRLSLISRNIREDCFYSVIIWLPVLYVSPPYHGGRFCVSMSFEFHQKFVALVFDRMKVSLRLCYVWQLRCDIFSIFVGSSFVTNGLISGTISFCVSFRYVVAAIVFSFVGDVWCAGLISWPFRDMYVELRINFVAAGFTSVDNAFMIFLWMDFN